MTRTAAELVAECVRALGVTGVWGDELPGLAARGAFGSDLDVRFSDAEGRLGPGVGAALAGQTLRLSQKPGGDIYRFTVFDPAELPEAVALWHLHPAPASYELRFEFELEAPVADELTPIPSDHLGPVPVLDPNLASEEIVIVAGPGVIRADAVAALATTATRAAAGVVNTWGAKGVFAWDDPRHHGTFGLQQRDLELSGVLEADLVITTGLDPLELPPGGVGTGLVFDVAPEQITALVHHWPDPSRAIPPSPPLYRELQMALAPLYRSDAVPIPPPRLTGALAESLGGDQVVVADPGVVGFWVARTFPTSRPGSVVVPATGGPGFAVDTAFVGARLGRRIVALAEGPPSDREREVIDRAASEGLPLTTIRWGSTGSLTAEEVAERAVDDRSVVDVVEVGVDWSVLDRVLDVAGPITAWSPPGDPQQN